MSFKCKVIFQVLCTAHDKVKKYRGKKNGCKIKATEMPKKSYKGEKNTAKVKISPFVTLLYQTHCE